MNRKMSLLEAYEYSKEHHCEVIHNGVHTAKCCPNTKVFRWTNGQEVIFNEHTTRGTWEKCEKEYTFAQALEMMLKGTWMRPIGGSAGRCYCFNDGRWFKTWSERISQDCCFLPSQDSAFTFSELTKPWIEGGRCC